MEIYIDNEKTRFGRKTQDLEKILKAITRKLEKNEKIIKSISINGHVLQENTIIDMTRPNIMEIETKSYSDLSLEALTNASEYIETFFEVRELLHQKIENKEKLDDYDIEETHNFLYWLLDVVHLLKETYVFSFSNMEEVFEALTEELAVLKEFKKKNDFIAYINALEYRVTDILENFKSNIDYYCKNIIEEEKIKKITI